MFGRRPQAPAVPTVDAAEAHRLHEAGDAVIIDVRETSEWTNARIPGAVHIPLGELRDRTDEVPRDTQVVVQCHSGSRSAMACQALRQAGWDNVHNLAGGIVAWHRSGLPIDQG